MADDKKPSKNIIDLAEKRAENEEEKGIKERISKSDKHSLLCKVLAGQLFPRAGKFPFNFQVYKLDASTNQIIEIDANGVCWHITKNRVQDTLCAFVFDCWDRLKNDYFSLVYDDLKSVVAAWRARTECVEKPHAVRFANEDGICFRKLPWDLQEISMAGEPTLDFPTFNEILSRTSNQLAFVTWIGSLFFAKADRQQYVWLYGEGKNGKGSISRFLAKVFGGAFASMQPPPLQGNRFWTWGLLGKRFVLFADCNDTKFVTSGFFKMLTGGDAVPVDPKGEKAFTAELDCKFMFNSNERPGISSERADLRRAIYCEMKAVESDLEDDQYEDRLWQEGGAFLNYCIHMYALHQGRRGHVAIPADDEVVRALVAENEEHFHTVFDKHFALASAGDGVFNWVSAPEFAEVLQAEFFGKDNKAARDFRSWLRRTHNIAPAQMRRNGEKTTLYSGLKKRPGYQGGQGLPSFG